MPKVCCVCGKGKVAGNAVSHANNHNKRTWKPNLRKVKAVVDGTSQKIQVCARCLRSNAIER